MASKQRRKQPSRAPSPAPAAEARSNGGGRWALIALAVVAVAGIGAFLLFGADRSVPAGADTASEASSAPASSTTASTVAASTGAPESSTPRFTSADLEGLPMPPLPYVAQTAGPADLMRQAYVFAARNPDVLEYVPCYCGCGMSDGHVSNVDCFVESRAPNGAVTEWDIHGMT